MFKSLSARAQLALPIISLVTFCGFLDSHLLIPVIAIYATELGATPGITGLIIGLYSITNTPSNIYFGRIIDKIGYRLPLLGGLIGSAAAMTLYAFCRLPVHLALVRILHGLSSGVIGPATMSAMVGASDKHNRAKAMGAYGMAIAAATLVAYPVCTLCMVGANYNLIFFLGAGILLFGAAISLLVPPANPLQPGANTAMPRTRARQLLRRPGLLAAYSAVFAQYFSFGGVVTLLPLYLGQLGLEAYNMGILLSIFAVIFIIIQLPAGAFCDRYGRMLPTVFGLSVGASALFLLAAAGTLPLMITAMALYGLAFGLLFPAISAMVADHSSTGERGVATGIFHALFTAGVAIGAPVIGWLAELKNVVFGLSVIPYIMLLALLLQIILHRRQSPAERGNDNAA